MQELLVAFACVGIKQQMWNLKEMYLVSSNSKCKNAYNLKLCHMICEATSFIFWVYLFDFF